MIRRVGRIYKKIAEGDEGTTLEPEEMDALAVLQRIQQPFTPDDLWDNYPVDDLVKDVFALQMMSRTPGVRFFRFLRR